MISLEQIRLLENRISKSLELMATLKEENATLRKGIESAQKRMRELEHLVESFKTDQNEIEEIILRALRTLDVLEDGLAPRPHTAHARIDTADRSEQAVKADPPQKSEVTAKAPAVESTETAARDGTEEGPKTKKGELDIF